MPGGLTGSVQKISQQWRIVQRTQLGAVKLRVPLDGIKQLAAGFVAEAHCPEDGMIEAIRHTGPSYIAAVQWHPEFHSAELGTLDDAPLLADFLDAARQSAGQIKSTA